MASDFATKAALQSANTAACAVLHHEPVDARLAGETKVRRSHGIATACWITVLLFFLLIWLKLQFFTSLECVNTMKIIDFFFFIILKQKCAFFFSTVLNLATFFYYSTFSNIDLIVKLNSTHSVFFFLFYNYFS